MRNVRRDSRAEPGPLTATQGDARCPTRTRSLPARTTRASGPQGIRGGARISAAYPHRSAPSGGLGGQPLDQRVLIGPEPALGTSASCGSAPVRDPGFAGGLTAPAADVGVAGRPNGGRSAAAARRRLTGLPHKLQVRRPSGDGLAKWRRGPTTEHDVRADDSRGAPSADSERLTAGSTRRVAVESRTGPDPC